ncbi:MAG: hypothetical protein KGL13_02590 [Gammaproteobacteria bacterium]|nr:hypothetical protein [Gammaproteobacteria bacterium]MDE2345334.1 hypothetical protein [Gammaproteobacteria bacterium]
MRISADKIASVTRNLRLDRSLTLTDAVRAEHGAVLAGRILGDKSSYNQLEDVHGRMNVLHGDDIIVGALGHRNALHGYEGVLPKSVAPGQKLHILNMGGVIGECVSHNPDVGPPFEFEVLGQVLVYPEFQSRLGEPANIRMGALHSNGLAPDCKVIYVAGTCMNAGKTAAACAIVRRLVLSGYRVGGAKLTGVSLMRDTLSMRDYGAELTLDFTDAGIVCTGPESAPQVAKTIFSELSKRNFDVIVAETGDGIMGDYGVQAILADPELRALSAAFVFCANDPVGVAGGVQHLQEDYGIRADVISGPATDNRVGVRFVEQQVGVTAINARTHAKALGDYLLARLAERGVGRAANVALASVPQA